MSLGAGLVTSGTGYDKGSPPFVFYLSGRSLRGLLLSIMSRGFMRAVAECDSRSLTSQPPERHMHKSIPLSSVNYLILGILELQQKTDKNKKTLTSPQNTFFSMFHAYVACIYTHTCFYKCVAVCAPMASMYGGSRLLLGIILNCFSISFAETGYLNQPQSLRMQLVLASQLALESPGLHSLRLELQAGSLTYVVVNRLRA